VKILIDTSCWLWSLATPERLNKRTRALLSDPAHTLYLSAASSWEIAIKAALGKLHLPEPPDKYVPSRMEALDIRGLPVEHAHALRVFGLPRHHRDPFDRILVAQAQTESLTILTADRAFAAYDVETIWAGASR
jgi:PIN domain nuclease of toxin-antitoxin system